MSSSSSSSSSSLESELRRAIHETIVQIRQQQQEETEGNDTAGAAAAAAADTDTSTTTAARSSTFAYFQAQERCPALIPQESDPVLYWKLRRVGWNLPKAAHLLVQYWQYRVDTFSRSGRSESADANVNVAAAFAPVWKNPPPSLPLLEENDDNTRDTLEERFPLLLPKDDQSRTVVWIPFVSRSSGSRIQHENDTTAATGKPSNEKDQDEDPEQDPEIRRRCHQLWYVLHWAAHQEAQQQQQSLSSPSNESVALTSPLNVVLVLYHREEKKEEEEDDPNQSNNEENMNKDAAVVWWERLTRAYRHVVEILPVEVTAVYDCQVGTTTTASTNQSAWKTILSPTTVWQSIVIEDPTSSTTTTLLSQLQSYGFSVSSLPSCLGGTWTYDAAQNIAMALMVTEENNQETEKNQETKGTIPKQGKDMSQPKHNEQGEKNSTVTVTSAAMTVAPINVVMAPPASAPDRQGRRLLLNEAASRTAEAASAAAENNNNNTDPVSSSAPAAATTDSAAALEDDFRQAVHKAVVALKQQQVKANQSGVFHPQTTAYEMALQRCPELIRRESDPLRFLQRTKWQVSAAARLLVQYWSLRYKLFGDRAFLPLDVTGHGALTNADVQVMKTGYVAFLPSDAQGRTVAFVDTKRVQAAAALQHHHHQQQHHDSRAPQPNEDDTKRKSVLVRSRCLFYLLTVASQEGVPLVVLRYSQDNEDCGEDIEKAKSEILETVPVELAAFYCLHRNSKNDKCDEGQFGKEWMGDYVKRVLHHYTFAKEDASSQAQLMQTLQTLGFQSTGLPTCVGGTWSYDSNFCAWIECRRQLEGQQDRKMRFLLPASKPPMDATEESQDIENLRKRKGGVTIGGSRHRKQRKDSHYEDDGSLTVGSKDGATREMKHHRRVSSTGSVSSQGSSTTATTDTHVEEDLRAAVHKAIREFPSNRCENGESDNLDREAYLQAVEKCPQLLRTESDPIRFLLRVHWHVPEAARLLVQYWTLRLQLFGAERAFLPLDLTGKGALTDADVEVMKTGYVVFLPSDSKGQTVAFVDTARVRAAAVCQDGDTKKSVLVRSRCLFYLLTVASQEGVPLIVLRYSEDDDDQGEEIEKAKSDLFYTAPVELAAFYCVQKKKRADGQKQGEDENDGKPHALFGHRWMDDYIKRVLYHFEFDDEASKALLIQKLNTLGFQPSGLPLCVGGTWSYDSRFLEWIEARRLLEQQHVMMRSSNKSKPRDTKSENRSSGRAGEKKLVSSVGSCGDSITGSLSVDSGHRPIVKQSPPLAALSNLADAAADATKMAVENDEHEKVRKRKLDVTYARQRRRREKEEELELKKRVAKLSLENMSLQKESHRLDQLWEGSKKILLEHNASAASYQMTAGGSVTGPQQQNDSLWLEKLLLLQRQTQSSPTVAALPAGGSPSASQPSSHLLSQLANLMQQSKQQSSMQHNNGTSSFSPQSNATGDFLAQIQKQLQSPSANQQNADAQLASVLQHLQKQQLQQQSASNVAGDPPLLSQLASLIRTQQQSAARSGAGGYFSSPSTSESRAATASDLFAFLQQQSFAPSTGGSPASQPTTEQLLQQLLSTAQKGSSRQASSAQVPGKTGDALNTLAALLVSKEQGNAGANVQDLWGHLQTQSSGFDDKQPISFAECMALAKKLQTIVPNGGQQASETSSKKAPPSTAQAQQSMLSDLMARMDNRTKGGGSGNLSSARAPENSGGNSDSNSNKELLALLSNENVLATLRMLGSAMKPPAGAP